MSGTVALSSINTIGGLSPGTLRLSTNRKNEKPDPATELLELQRQYRIIENERKQYQDKTQGVLRRQELTMQQFEEENEKLRLELKMIQSQLAHTQQTTWTDKVSQLTQSITAFNNKIDQERNSLEQHEREIKDLEQRITEHQTLIGGAQAGTINDQQTLRLIKVQENRIEKAQTKYNEILAVNKTQREQIDHMKRERSVFENIFKKLERDIADRKKKMAALIEESNYAYEARDDTQNKMNSMKDRLQKEISDHEAEIRELDRMIEQENRRGNAETSRGNGDEMERTNPMAFQRAIRPGSNILQSSEDMPLRKKRPTLTASNEDDAKSDITSLTTHMDQTMEETFRKALAAWSLSPNHSSLEDFVSKFITGEYQNFSLFNYVNELNNDSERLEEEISQLRAEIAKLEGVDSSGSTLRAQLLASLSSQLTASVSKAEYYDQKTAHTLKVISSLRAPVMALHQKIGCRSTSNNSVTDTNLHTPGRSFSNSKSINNLNTSLNGSGSLTANSPNLGGGGGVTESNILSYLGEIEQRADEVIKVVLEKEKDDYEDRNNGISNGENNISYINGGSGQLLPGLTHQNMTNLLAKCPPLVIDPPTTGEDYDEDTEDDALHPFSREELKEKARGVNKKPGKKEKPKRRVDLKILSPKRR
eukprot:TRINITY_DN7826_c0_g1_i1.p1 TRINITY_DN7826_c0_g1~~TRINITY_DN7826_c0_g1_i1.p1  ORF type:complete len:650 (+),score=138.07 TRINITY_DN7826_c0_g1_i1:279-2228(+)